MNKYEDEKIYTYLIGQKKLKQLVTCYKNNTFKKASVLLLTYPDDLDAKNPYLRYKLCLETENTVLHKIALLMKESTFKPLFEAMHTILQYHPELAIQDNIDACLPLNYATEIVENQLEILCALMFEPKKFKTAEEYFAEKTSIPKCLSITMVHKKNNNDDNDDKDTEHEKPVQKSSSFKLFSFSKHLKRPHSNSITILSCSNKNKN